MDPLHTSAQSGCSSLLPSAPLLTLAFAFCACGGGTANTTIGYSNLNTSATGEELTEGQGSDERAEDSSGADPQAKPKLVDEETDASNEVDGPLDKDEPKEAAVARRALHEAPTSDNPMGLVFTIAERTSDLRWVLAIENRSTHVVHVAALPELLSFEVTPPSLGGGIEPTNKADSPRVAVCGTKNLPTSLSAGDQSELAPGQLIFHAFDPRPLCEDDGVLTQGAQVKAKYGFPIKMKKLWQGGKMVEVEAEQKAPYVAERPSEGDEKFVPMKIIESEEFVLGRTYPLNELTPFAEGQERPEPVEGEVDALDQRKPPITLVISPLGTSTAPESKDVSLKIVNTSGKPMKLFVRRELITYEVNGPTRSFTCRMQPADRHPTASEFMTLSIGGSTSLQTRLAEACPIGVWTEPGNYAVSARMSAQASGEEPQLDAFVGTGVTTRPAHLIIPSGGEQKATKMAVIPSQSPH